MNWYIFKSQIISLYMSASPSYTTIHFKHNILDYVGAKKGILRIVKMKDNKTLMLENLSKTSPTTLSVLTERNSLFVFKLTTDRKHYVPFVNLMNAKRSSYGRVLMDNEDFKFVENKKSVLIINKSGKDLSVNGEEVPVAKYFNKGPLLVINNKFEYYNQTFSKRSK